MPSIISNFSGVLYLQASIKRGLWFLFVLCSFVFAEGDWVVVEKAALMPFDQNTVSKVACGPAAALNTLRFSDEEWGRYLKEVEQDTDEQTLRNLIYKRAHMSSTTHKGQRIWSETSLMSAPDYVEFLNSFRGSAFWRKKLKRHEVAVDGSAVNVAEIYELLSSSIKEGVTPTLELVLLVKPEVKDVSFDRWAPIVGHFVVVLGVKKEGGFIFLNIADSDGGRKYIARLSQKASKKSSRPSLVFEAKGFELWKALQSKYTNSQLSITGVVGEID